MDEDFVLPDIPEGEDQTAQEALAEVLQLAFQKIKIILKRPKLPSKEFHKISSDISKLAPLVQAKPSGDDGTLDAFLQRLLSTKSAAELSHVVTELGEEIDQRRARSGRPRLLEQGEADAG